MDYSSFDCLSRRIRTDSQRSGLSAIKVVVHTAIALKNVSVELL
jgi:hypothetical protein